MSKKTTIVIADDHPLIRSVLSALIQKNARLTLLGQAANGQEAIRLVQDLAPDILLLDLLMPVMNGKEVIQWLRQHAIPIHIIVFSAIDKTETIHEVLDMGADQYLVKGNPPSELLQALEKVEAPEQVHKVMGSLPTYRSM